MTDISLKADVIFDLGFMQITNTVLGGFLATALLTTLIVLVIKRSKLIPGRMQLVFEMAIQTFLDYLVSAYGDKKRAMKYLPFYITLFIYLMLVNQFGVLPLINSIVTGEEGTFLFRTASADFSQTIALAIPAVLGTHFIALTIRPLKHIGSFINIAPFFKVRSLGDLANAFLELFLGVLDIIGEFAKLISLSARLFGNIFAGEVMVVVISGIAFWTGYVVPIPFLILSIFSGLVQAYVFAVLSLQFTALTLNGLEEENSEAPTTKELKTAKSTQ